MGLKIKHDKCSMIWVGAMDIHLSGFLPLKNNSEQSQKRIGHENTKVLPRVLDVVDAFDMPFPSVVPLGQRDDHSQHC